MKPTIDADALSLVPPRFGPDGLSVYLGSGDMQALDRGDGPTLALLRRCGATAALVLVESVDGRRQSPERVERVCDRLRAADIAPLLYAFPDVTGDLSASIAHLAACREATRAPCQWDIEPRHDAGSVTHWTPALLGPLLTAEPLASITTTRRELGRLGDHGREVWLQLEAQTSTDTLAQALSKAPDAVLVTGLFDSTGDPRDLREVVRDLERCTVQAKRTGRHAVWSAQSMSVAEADALRSWALGTWPS